MKLLTQNAGLQIGRFKRFSVYVGKHFVRDNCLQIAASLAYTSLLSVVPLMAVTFSMLAAFPVFQQMGQDLQNFVFANFIPAAGEVVQSYLQTFAAKASKLTIVGIIVLVLTALMMMSTIDKALNVIWRSQGRRKGAARFMVYWAVLSLGPVLVGMGMVATSYVASLSFIHDTVAVTGFKTFGLRLLPFFTTALAFTLLYMIVPARSVPVRVAFAGGLFAGLLFEAAKRAFAFYVTNFPTYEAIYGALATIPIFLIWIYLSWVIILLGAVIAHSLLVYRDDPLGEHESHNTRRYVLAARIIGHLWSAQKKGKTISERKLAKYEHRFDEDMLSDVLVIMEAAKFVHRTENGRWALARDPSELTLLDIYRLIPGPLYKNSCSENDDDRWQIAFDRAMQSAGESLEKTLGITIRDLLDLDDNTARMLVQKPADIMQHQNIEVKGERVRVEE